jgi:tetratricopeptide (TPR) repeat protein
MLKARLKPPEQGTLERRYEFHLGEAIRAALAGDSEKAAGHSGVALSISRELYCGSRQAARHRPGLAAALASHARYRQALESVELLTESAGHYAALAQGDPAAYEVERIDVLVRVALAIEASGNPADAIRLLREAVRMYRHAPSANPAARDAALARACFHLGRCLLRAGEASEGLAYTDAGLGVAAALPSGALPSGALPSGALPSGALPSGALPSGAHRDPGWLSVAPRTVQVLAPDWLTAATRAMALHAAAGRWPAAATAAGAAARVSGGLAAIGGDERREAHVAIIARARAIWARAHDADTGVAGTAALAGEAQPSCDSMPPSDSMVLASANRFRERSTSASAAARSVQRAPSTDLPGSRSL